MTRLFPSRALPVVALAALSMVALGCNTDSGDPGDPPLSDAGAASTCVPTAAACYATNASEPGAECLAKADNTGANLIQLRVSQLEVSSPPVLAAPFMQDAIITKKVTLTEPDCFQNGDAQFNTLFEFDKSTMTLTAGGAPPQALVGPAKDGTCFDNFTDKQSGIVVGPTKTTFTQTGNDVTAVFNAGSSKTPPEPDLVLPIYLLNQTDQYVLLPLHKVNVTATLSTDQNCVGKFNGDSLDPKSSCLPPQGSFAWTNGGSYSAYVTVAESDTVMVQSLGYSLCVLLSGNVAKWKGPQTVPCGKDSTGKSVTCSACKGSTGYTENNNQLPQGDWCSSSDSAGGCKDAFHLVTKFAASATKINGTFDPATKKCSG